MIKCEKTIKIEKSKFRGHFFGVIPFWCWRGWGGRGKFGAFIHFKSEKLL